MKDANMTDSLLAELEQLEASADALDEQLTHNREQQQKAANLPSSSALDAAALALEAAKTAQEAATHSQKAAEASLNHSHRQKEQVMELSDANFAWRQAVKTATQELQASKKRFAMMLGVSVFSSLAAVAALGWMLYSLHGKEAQFKGEVLDIIQTENLLHGKQITVKVDEMASLLELLAAEVKKLAPSGAALAASDAQSKAPLVDLQNEAPPEETVPPTEAPAVEAAPGVVTALAELKPLIEEIKQAQHQLLQELQTPKASPAASNATQTVVASPAAPAEVASSSGLTEAQQKQLNDIGWLVKKQSKLLESIQAKLQTWPAASTQGKTAQSANYQTIQASLEELKAQMTQLKTQQSALQEQVKTLQSQTEKLSAAPKPYSYRLPN